jgi:hypothetical protein
MASAVVPYVRRSKSVIDDSTSGFCEYHRFHGVKFPAKNIPTRMFKRRAKESKMWNFAITMRPKDIANLGETVKFLLEQASRCHAMLEPTVYPDPCNGCAHAHYHLPEPQKIKISQLVATLSTGYAMLNMREKDPIFYISTLRNSENWKAFIKVRYNRSMGIPLMKNIVNNLGIMSFSFIHQKAELKASDVEMLSNPGAAKRILQTRDEIAHEVAYDKVKFTRANTAEKGWPALFAIIYNLWLKYDFDRNKFPKMFRPLHVYLVGESQIGKTTLVSKMVAKGTKNKAKMNFPCSSSSEFKWSTIDIDKAPKIVHFEEYRQSRWDMDELLR